MKRIVNILVCDTGPVKNDPDCSYNLEKICLEIGINPKITEIKNINTVEQEIKKQKPDLLVVSYNFQEDDSYEVIGVIERHRDIPSIFLDYPAHMGISRYVADTTPAVCVYKHEAKFVLESVIRRVLKP